MAKRLEDAGDYEGARKAMGPLWQQVGKRPQVEGLSAHASGEVLLRAGVLSGWIGSSQQIESSQEVAKDLISESEAIFESLGETDKVVEARAELSYCYWREGAFDEARVILRDVLVRLEGRRDELTAIAQLRAAIVESAATRYSDAMRILNEAAPLFDASDDHALKGKFHNELASVLNYLSAAERREDYRDRALLEYAAASFHFEQAEHTRYHAAVENNLGFLFLSAGRFNDAHLHLDRARRLFVRLKDSVHIAQADETRARAFLSEGRFVEAEKVARHALGTLRKGGEYALLAEALTTHGTALARMGRHVPARAALESAIRVAQQAGSPEGAGLAALTIIEELGDHLSVDEIISVYEEADQFLADSQHPKILQRMRGSARKVFKTRSGKGESRVMQERQTPGRKNSWDNFSLKEEVRRLEEHYIEQALRDAEGKVSQAAKLLGFTDHGSLNSLLKGKHQHLLALRLPSTPRKRSIISSQRVKKR
ncbi:MAG TPA: tetratricopeptide repeat protein [Pyrinomonadaceae bacterium]|nr:tetratricopeptide repeat protein [Pyrinomonadaceae bacterium]